MELRLWQYKISLLIYVIYIQNKSAYFCMFQAFLNNLFVSIFAFEKQKILPNFFKIIFNLLGFLTHLANFLLVLLFPLQIISIECKAVIYSQLVADMLNRSTIILFLFSRLHRICGKECNRKIGITLFIVFLISHVNVYLL